LNAAPEQLRAKFDINAVKATRAGTLLTGAAQKAWVRILNIDASQGNAGLTAFQSTIDLPGFKS
jgi:hypothetical protein